MKYSSNKDLNRVIVFLHKKGWSVEFSKHLKLKAPDGKVQVTCSISPSCPFAHRKVIADIRRYGGYKYEALK